MYMNFGNYESAVIWNAALVIFGIHSNLRARCSASPLWVGQEGTLGARFASPACDIGPNGPSFRLEPPNAGT